MPKTLAQLRCPNCQAPVQSPVEQIIDVSKDPAAKARLLSGSLNMAQCPSCGHRWQIATPIVYHDPEKELLLTFLPVEMALPLNEQERILGRLIKQIADDLPPEKRKAYILQPKAVLTFQGLLEKILEADGISREQLEAQRDKMHLLEELIRLSEDKLAGFIQEHDSELDANFFQLASLTIQTTPDKQAVIAAAQRIESALRLTSFGKQLAAQEEELRAAAESLNQYKDKLTRKVILDLCIDAPDENRVSALVSLIRPAMDYEFFSLLTNRIDSSSGDQKTRIINLRKQLLELTEEIDNIEKARVAQAGSLLQALVNTPETDLDNAIKEVLPMIDQRFLSILQANIHASEEQNDRSLLEQLRKLDQRIHDIILESMPAGIQFAQKIINIEDEAEAIKTIKASADQIDDEFLNTLISASKRFEESGDTKQAERLNRLYRRSLRASMRAKMQT
jgi:hypothetical protein